MKPWCTQNLNNIQPKFLTAHMVCSMLTVLLSIIIISLYNYCYRTTTANSYENTR